MGQYQEVDGNLISLAKEGKFDVIGHGVNCFCTMGAGIAPQMAKEFGCDKFPLEQTKKLVNWADGEEYWEKTNNRGNINKLGQIDYRELYIWKDHPMGGPRIMNHMSKGQKKVSRLIVVNAYTQYDIGVSHLDPDLPAVDYEAITMCMRKMNHEFKGKHIGLPLIGCGLAGGIWDYNLEEDFSDDDIMDYKKGSKKDVKTIIKEEFKDCNVTIVKFKK